jgi:hypothetical protein
MAIEKELVREELIRNAHKFHSHPPHIHSHPPHIPNINTPDLSLDFSNNSGNIPATSGSGSGGIFAAVGASMAAYPVTWAIGAVVVVGVIGVIAYNALKED